MTEQGETYTNSSAACEKKFAQEDVRADKQYVPAAGAWKQEEEKEHSPRYW